jgi:hypothetical protein
MSRDGAREASGPQGNTCSGTTSFGTTDRIPASDQFPCYHRGMGRSGRSNGPATRRPYGEDDLERFRRELLEAAGIDDQIERLLEVAAIITEAVADLDVRPVVVGGLALAYWSDSPYRTGEIDFVMARAPGLQDRLGALGFERSGRHWVMPGHPIAFEAPGDTLVHGDQGEWAELRSGRRVFVLTGEDMVLWRIREWIHWHQASGFQQAAQLLVSEGIDQERLERRAAEVGLALALTELKAALVRIEQGERFEAWEIEEKGKQIERQSYNPSDE